MQVISSYSTLLGKLLLKAYNIDISKICDTDQKMTLFSNAINCNEASHFANAVCNFVIDFYSICIKNFVQLFFHQRHQSLTIMHRQTLVKSSNITVQFCSDEDCLLIDNLKVKHVHVVKTKELKSDTFSYCLRLKTVIADKTLETICGDAFSNCISLKCVFLPKTIKHICSNAYSNCINLEKVIFY